MNATVPDLLRLLAVPLFAWAAYRDVKTRRVPNRAWYPLLALAIGALVWETWHVYTDPLLDTQLFAVRVLLSVGLLIPLAYGFWWIGGFGGADAKAFMIIAVLFPTYPAYPLLGIELPIVRPTVGVFSLSILSNTVIAGVVYPVGLAVQNILAGHVGTVIFIGRPISWQETTRKHGRLLETTTGVSRSGLDLDALRMYLTYRGSSLEELRRDPDRYRDPASLPENPNPPGDGSLAGTTTSEPATSSTESASGPDPGADPGSTAETETESATDDPWGAAAFLSDIEYTAYGTTPEQLRDGLDVLVNEDTVWFSPGIPFFVPLFVGLVLALTYGDLLFSLLSPLLT